MHRVAFLAFGDWGYAGPDLTQLGNALAVFSRTFRPDFINILGDNFYPTGVESEFDEKFDTVWKQPFLSHPELHVPWKVVLGNHDYGMHGQGRPEAQVHFEQRRKDFHLGLWQMSGDRMGPEFVDPDTKTVFPPTCYSYKKEDDVHNIARFYCFDTNACQNHVRRSHPFIQRKFASDKAWLSSELAKPENQSLWNIFFGHHPFYTDGVEHSVVGICLRVSGDYPDKKGAMRTGMGLGEVVEKRFDAYFAGHEHVTQYKLDAKNKCHHYVVGGTVQHGFYGDEVPKAEKVMDWVHTTATTPSFVAVEIITNFEAKESTLVMKVYEVVKGTGGVKEIHSSTTTKTLP